MGNATKTQTSDQHRPFCSTQERFHLRQLLQTRGHPHTVLFVVQLRHDDVLFEAYTLWSPLSLEQRLAKTDNWNLTARGKFLMFDPKPSAAQNLVRWKISKHPEDSVQMGLRHCLRTLFGTAWGLTGTVDGCWGMVG